VGASNAEEAMEGLKKNGINNNPKRRGEMTVAKT
jgi:hypothetical protein